MSDELRDAIDRLPREIPPERDLWPGIARRLDASPGVRSRGRELVALAAALSTIALLTAALALLARPTSVASRPGPSRPEPETPSPQVSMVDALAASTEPLRARLLADAASDPARAELMEAHVAGLRASIEHLEGIVRREPTATDAVMALARARRQELGLLLRASRRFDAR